MRRGATRETSANVSFPYSLLEIHICAYKKPCKRLTTDRLGAGTITYGRTDRTTVVLERWGTAAVLEPVQISQYRMLEVDYLTGYLPTAQTHGPRHGAWM